MGSSLQGLGPKISPDLPKSSRVTIRRVMNGFTVEVDGNYGLMVFLTLSEAVKQAEIYLS